jgi:DNA-binding NtrC family response regulator
MVGPILVIDDDADVLRAARFALKETAARVDGLASPEGAVARLAEGGFEVVLLDMNFAAGEYRGREGLDALAEIQAADPTLSVLLMTAYGGVSLAVEALKRGAVDFILKPWRNGALIEAVGRAAALTVSRRAEDSLDLDRIERAAIAEALARHGGNISQAAAALGLTRPALYRRIEKHGL